MRFDSLAMTYGQQSMNLTTIQVAAGFSSLVNGGQYYKPTILVGTIDESGNLKSSEKKVYSPNRKRRHIIADANDANDGAPIFHSYQKATNLAMKSVEKLVLLKRWLMAAYTQKETIAAYISYGSGKNDAKYIIMVTCKQLQARGLIYKEISTLDQFLQIYPTG
ncbi:hypothetical protein KOY48_01815 [Candidatus Minimicrobia naudis]|uniref:Uncharacterized protein n=1 Tax=Candidatus Minimicrobia naudis TaxID=2841263 RepID=A0A8F1MBT3_9BACT|nr:hypothetical protein KOY48_01815 [Candidatus Minimicrobia naudis]